MAQEQQRAAPYVPFSTFKTGIEALQRGVPEVLDKSLWRSLSGTSQSHVMSAFRFLELIDDENRVQPVLRNLVEDRENRKAVLRDILERSYPSLVALAKSNATMPQLSTAMEKYGVKGDTVSKAVSFFLKAAEEAELPVSPLWKSATRKRNGNGQRKRKVSAGRENGGNPEEPIESLKRKEKEQQQPPSPINGVTRTVELRSGGQVSLGYSVDLFDLDKDDQTFVLDLIARLRAYEATPAKRDTSEDEALPAKKEVAPL